MIHLFQEETVLKAVFILAKRSLDISVSDLQLFLFYHSRYLDFLQRVECKQKKEFFHRIRKEFQDIRLDNKRDIITPTEHKNFNLISRNGFVTSMFVLILKQWFSIIIRISVLGRIYKKLKQV